MVPLNGVFFWEKHFSSISNGTPIKIFITCLRMDYVIIYHCTEEFDLSRTQVDPNIPYYTEEPTQYVCCLFFREPRTENIIRDFTIMHTWIWKTNLSSIVNSLVLCSLADDGMMPKPYGFPALVWRWQYGYFDWSLTDTDISNNRMSHSIGTETQLL